MCGKVIFLEGNNFVGKSTVRNLLAKKLGSTIEIAIHDFYTKEDKFSIVMGRYEKFLNLIKNIGKTHVIVDRFLISDDVLFTNFYKESLKIRKISYIDKILIMLYDILMIRNYNKINSLNSYTFLFTCDFPERKKRIDKSYPYHMQEINNIKEIDLIYKKIFIMVPLNNKYIIDTTNKTPEEVVNEIYTEIGE